MHKSGKSNISNGPIVGNYGTTDKIGFRFTAKA